MLWTVVAIWGPCCALTFIIFGLDERSHRRQTALPAPVQTRVETPRAAPRALSLSKS